MIWRKILQLVLIIFIANNSFCQSDYNPGFLIPFCDHGMWGWSDTLGKIAINPEFQECSFFKKQEESWISTVKKDSKFYPYIYGKGLLPLENCTLYYTQSNELKNRNWWIVKTNDGHCGLYDLTKKQLLIDTTMDSWSIDFQTPGYLVYHSTDAFFRLFDINKKKIIQTNMTDYYWDYDFNVLYYLNSPESKEAYKLSAKGTFVKADVVVEYAHEGNQFSVSDGNKGMNRDIFNYFAISLNDIHLPDNFIPYKSIEIRKEIFVVFRKDGRFGLMRYSDQAILLDNLYDFIDIDYKNGLFYLIKDGKMGVKIVSTAYPEIQAQYDFIKVHSLLHLNRYWTFTIFEVTMNGQNMFVGENGVEYFKIN